MAAEPVDLVIAGAGPAGLATAIRGRQAGLDVVVLDRARPPLDPACGEGLMPDGAARLEALGVEIPADRSAPFKGVRYLDGALAAEGDFPGRPGLGIRRIELHRALIERAEAIGVRLRWGVTVAGLEEAGFVTGDGVVVGRFLVAADGRASRIRRWAGLDRPAAATRRVGLRRHFEIEPWTEHVEVYWSDDCEAYVTPVGPRLVGVAILRDRGAADYEALLHRFPLLQARLGGARAATRLRGAGPFGQRSRAVVRGRLALVGDATGSLDPITGEGLSLAFQQAFALVAAVEADDLQRYADEWRRLWRIPQALTSLLLVAERRPWLRRRVVRALAANRGLFEQLLAWSSREELPRLLGKGSVVTMALRLARHGV